MLQISFSGKMEIDRVIGQIVDRSRSEQGIETSIQIAVLEYQGPGRSKFLGSLKPIDAKFRLQHSCAVPGMR